MANLTELIYSNKDAAIAHRGTLIVRLSKVMDPDDEKARKERLDGLYAMYSGKDIYGDIAKLTGNLKTAKTERALTDPAYATNTEKNEGTDEFISAFAEADLDGTLVNAGNTVASRKMLAGDGPIDIEHIPSYYTTVAQAPSGVMSALIPNSGSEYLQKPSREDIITVPKANTIANIKILSNWDNSDTRVIYETENFLLNRVNEAEAEKYQITETFSENIINMFGSRPKVQSFSGVLLNTESHNWRDQFYRGYQMYMRGTECIKSNNRAYLVYQGRVIEGYIMNLTIGLNADNQNVCPFSFNMFITNYTSF